MTSEERAMKLISAMENCIDYNVRTDDVGITSKAIPIVLDYADEIRRECVRMAKLHLVRKSGFSSLEAAIMGKED